jgi:WD40 repeat protein
LVGWSFLGRLDGNKKITKHDLKGLDEKKRKDDGKSREDENGEEEDKKVEGKEDEKKTFVDKNMKDGIIISGSVAHEEDVTILLYSIQFFQLLSIDLKNVVNVWNAYSRRNVFRFHAEHRETITTACLDPSGRRLLTGAGDGVVKIWNFNEGSCFRTIVRERLILVVGE